MTAQTERPESPQKMPPGGGRAVIIGAGAVGTHLAASLRPGVRLLVVDPNRKVREAFGAQGVETTEFDASMLVSGPFEPGDVAILATSASRVVAAAARIPPWVPIVCVANGVETGLDPARSGGLSFGVVEFAASSPSPGRAVRTRTGWLTLLRGSSAAEWLAGAIDPTRQRTRLVGDLNAHRRAKLMINASLDPVAAVIGGTLGRVFQGRQSFAAFRVLLREALAVARASRWRLASIQGLTPGCMQLVFGIPLVGTLAAHVAGRQAQCIESTLAREIARGELGEADQLNGAIVRQGAAVGIATPAHTRALELLRRLAFEGGGGRPDLARELIVS